MNPNGLDSAFAHAFARQMVLEAAPTSCALVRLVNEEHSDQALIAIAALALATKTVMTFALADPAMPEDERRRLVAGAEAIARYIGGQVHVGIE